MGPGARRRGATSREPRPPPVSPRGSRRASCPPARASSTPGATRQGRGEVPLVHCHSRVLRTGPQQGDEERAEDGDPEGTRELVRGEHHAGARPGVLGADRGQDHADEGRRDDPLPGAGQGKARRRREGGPPPGRGATAACRGPPPGAAPVSAGRTRGPSCLRPRGWPVRSWRPRSTETGTRSGPYRTPVYHDCRGPVGSPRTPAALSAPRTPPPPGPYAPEGPPGRGPGPGAGRGRG